MGTAGRQGGNVLGATRRSPWWLGRRDQIVLYALCLALLGVVGARVAVGRWGAAREVRLLQAGERIDYRVNLNTASEAELDLLPGIGPAKARRIVEYRDAHGPFQRIDDLANVPGIHRNHVANVRELVAVGEPPRGGEPSQ